MCVWDVFFMSPMSFSLSLVPLKATLNVEKTSSGTVSISWENTQQQQETSPNDDQVTYNELKYRFVHHFSNLKRSHCIEEEGGSGKS